MVALIVAGATSPVQVRRNVAVSTWTPDAATLRALNEVCLGR
jgi:hypothetical protein